MHDEIHINSHGGKRSSRTLETDVPTGPNRGKLCGSSLDKKSRRSSLQLLKKEDEVKFELSSRRQSNNKDKKLLTSLESIQVWRHTGVGVINGLLTSVYLLI